MHRQLENDGFGRPDSYHFSFHSVQISEYQENVINIKDVTTVEPSCDDRNILKLEIDICENKSHQRTVISVVKENMRNARMMTVNHVRRKY